MTLILNPASDEVQAAFLKAHLKMVKVGLMPKEKHKGEKDDT